MLITVSDLLALLDKIPIWKTLYHLPGRVAALEQRLARLEASPPAPADENCPKCHAAAFKLIASAPDATMGPLGYLRRVYRCSVCSHEEPRLVAP